MAVAAWYLFGPYENGEKVIVDRVRAGGPADGTGLAAGDVITAVDGHTISTDDATAWYYPGTRLQFTLARGGTIEITAGPARASP